MASKLRVCATPAHRVIVARLGAGLLPGCDPRAALWLLRIEMSPSSRLAFSGCARRANGCSNLAIKLLARRNHYDD
jgi:hypothetical protein